MYALIFVIFDVEILFLYHWGFSYQQSGLAAFGSAAFFIIIIFPGLIYEWSEKNWNGMDLERISDDFL